MSNINPFIGTTKTNAELLEFLEKLQEMLVSGVRQSTFRDQTLIFRSTREIKQNISWLQEILVDKGEIDGNLVKAKKQVRFSTRNKGFR